jgi:raffinose/stachyose/melibiose transport system permease protein
MTQTKADRRERPAASPGPAVRRRRTGRRSRVGRAPLSLYLFPVPLLVLYVVFFAVPTLQALQYAMTDWDGFSADFAYVGIDNFVKLATNDDLFHNAVFNSVQFMLTVVVLQTMLSLVLGILLVRNTRGSVFLRALFFFPTILSSVSVAFIWRFIYDPNVGLANRLLDAVGLDALRSAYLGEPALAIFFVALTQVWAHAGQLMVVYIAGLQQVPAELNEAAVVDGAGRWQRFRYITWPMIAPATTIVMAYTTLQSFKVFDLILGLDGNPPRPSLDTMATRIYSTFADNEFGFAAAESVVFMVVIALVVFLQRRAVRLTQRGE